MDNQDLECRIVCIAVSKHRLDVVRKLLNAGMPASAKALETAVRLGNISMATLLVSYGARSQHALEIARNQDDQWMVKELLQDPDRLSRRV